MSFKNSHMLLYKPQDGTTKLQNFATLFNMCILQEEEDFHNFL